MEYPQDGYLETIFTLVSPNSQPEKRVKMKYGQQQPVPASFRVSPGRDH